MDLRNVTVDSAIIPQKVDSSKAVAARPVETFWLERDPLTGERLEPSYRAAIPVYDAVTGELREFLP
jgi:hypothetical protein